MNIFKHVDYKQTIYILVCKAVTNLLHCPHLKCCTLPDKHSLRLFFFLFPIQNGVVLNYETKSKHNERNEILRNATKYTKMRNETQRNEIYWNAKRNATKRNILKCEMKRNETEFTIMRNERKWIQRNEKKYTKVRNAIERNGI